MILVGALQIKIEQKLENLMIESYKKSADQIKPGVAGELADR